MHGRKKQTQPPSQKELEGIKKKIAIYSNLVGIAFDRRRNGDTSMETLDLTGKLLSSFPDFYSMWNFRREILIENYKETTGLGLEQNNVSKVTSLSGVGDESSTSSSSGGGSGSTTPATSIVVGGVKISTEVGGAIRDVELKLSAECIQKNPKSYPAWHHRKWILARFEVDYEAEFNLCKEFLKLDQRNFHCWNYRRHVASVSGIPEIASKECGFSDDKIKENFSNYSAFHHRSVYIFNNESSASTSIEVLLDREFEIVLSAIFTEPDDQSAWWYHQFLLANIRQSKDASFAQSILEKQLSQVESLVDMEPDCKLAKVAITSILEHYIRLNKDGEKSIEYREKRRDMLNALAVSDQMHARRYQYLLSLPI